MNRRLPNSRPTPNLTRGDETPATPCVGRWDVYDALVDHKGGPILHHAVREARELCGACPIMADCFRENQGEDWVKTILTVTKRASRDTGRCGTYAGAAAHDRLREEVCVPCREARAAKRIEYKRKKAAA